jgi:hypothetical protein
MLPAVAVMEKRSAVIAKGLMLLSYARGCFEKAIENLNLERVLYQNACKYRLHA